MRFFFYLSNGQFKENYCKNICFLSDRDVDPFFGLGGQKLEKFHNLWRALRANLLCNIENCVCLVLFLC